MSGIFYEDSNLPMKPEVVVTEDRGALSELLNLSERNAISITLSGGEIITLPDDWRAIREQTETGHLKIISDLNEGTWSFDIDEIVRVNALSSGELLWETRRGEAVWPDALAVQKLQKLQGVAKFYFPFFGVVMLNYYLGWNLFGKFDGIATLISFGGMLLLISSVPRSAEII